MEATSLNLAPKTRADDRWLPFHPTAEHRKLQATDAERVHTWCRTVGADGQQTHCALRVRKINLVSERRTPVRRSVRKASSGSPMVYASPSCHPRQQLSYLSVVGKQQKQASPYREQPAYPMPALGLVGRQRHSLAGQLLGVCAVFSVWAWTWRAARRCGPQSREAQSPPAPSSLRQCCCSLLQKRTRRVCTAVACSTAGSRDGCLQLNEEVFVFDVLALRDDAEAAETWPNDPVKREWICDPKLQIAPVFVSKEYHPDLFELCELCCFRKPMQTSSRKMGLSVLALS